MVHQSDSKTAIPLRPSGVAKSLPHQYRLCRLLPLEGKREMGEVWGWQVDIFGNNTMKIVEVRA